MNDIYFYEGPKIEIRFCETESAEDALTHRKIGFTVIYLVALLFSSLLFSMAFGQENSTEGFLVGGIAAIALLGSIIVGIRTLEKIGAEQQTVLKQQAKDEDIKALNNLVGEDLSLAPPVANGTGKLRIFYTLPSGETAVWYSQSLFAYQQNGIESIIDFETNTVHVPRFAWTPAVPRKDDSE